MTDSHEKEEGQSDSEKPTVKQLLSRSPEEIVSFLSGTYHESGWVADALVEQKEGTVPLQSIETVSDLAEAMKIIVDQSDRKVEILRAHPDLCVGKLEQLSNYSIEEQGRAGLLSLSAEDLEEFTKLNEQYRAKFGFPFILAVRNATKYTVFAAVRGRLRNNSVEEETVCALTQVHKIAWMRLLARLSTADSRGHLSCHVLDTANGTSATNIRVLLHRVSPPEQAGLIGEFRTNKNGYVVKEDGSSPPLQGGNEFSVGVYTLTFFVADYFAISGKTYFAGTPFLDEVPLRFGIDNPYQHFDLLLTVSPWSLELLNARETPITHQRN